MGSRKKRSLDGLSEESGRYAVPAHKNEILTTVAVGVDSGVNVNTDSNIRFRWKIDPDKLGRFAENCFRMSYKMTMDRTPLTGATTAEEKAVKWMTRAADLKPAIYIDTVLDGAAFFSRVEVKINNHTIAAHDMENFGHVYQAINRRFATDAFAKEKYGKKFAKISDWAERNCADATKMTAAQLEATRSLSSDNWNKSEPLLTTFGMDGVWPLTCQSNVLAALTGERVPNGYLRPETEVSVTLFKRHPIQALVDSMLITDQMYMTADAVDDASATPPLHLEIVDIVMLCESYKPDPSEMIRYTRRIAKWYGDVPLLETRLLTDKVKETTDKFDVPAGTKAVVLVWLHNSQVFYDEASKKNLHTRFHFPPESTELHLRLNEKKGLLFEAGMMNLGPAMPQSPAGWSPTAMSYHEGLVKVGLYEREFEKMFPRKVAGSQLSGSYDQVVFVDLTRYNVENEHNEMTVKMSYKKASPETYWLFFICLRQFLFQQDPTGKVTYEVAV